MKKLLSDQEIIDKITEAQGIIHKVCRTYCYEPEERQDLFQEMVIQLWKSYHSYKDEAKFSSWMYRVCLNVALQRIRKDNSKGHKALVKGVVPEVADEKYTDEYQEEAEMLLVAIRRLNEVEKAIILLYLEEKSNAEIADIVGISQNYVRVKMNRIKKKLKDILNPDPDAD